jgi:hypothetical protein
MKCQVNCDNRNIDNTCMFGITKELIQYAKSGKPMCEILRKEVLQHVNQRKKNLDT